MLQAALNSNIKQLALNNQIRHSSTEESSPLFLMSTSITPIHSTWILTYVLPNCQWHRPSSDLTWVQSAPGWDHFDLRKYYVHQKNCNKKIQFTLCEWFQLQSALTIAFHESGFCKSSTWSLSSFVLEFRELVCIHYSYAKKLLSPSQFAFGLSGSFAIKMVHFEPVLRPQAWEVVLTLLAIFLRHDGI